MLYQEPILEILYFEVDDVVCASVNDYYEDKKDGNYSDASNDENWT